MVERHSFPLSDSPLLLACRHFPRFPGGSLRVGERLGLGAEFLETIAAEVVVALAAAPQHRPLAEEAPEGVVRCGGDAGLAQVAQELPGPRARPPLIGRSQFHIISLFKKD